MKILLADDHNVLRKGLRRILEEQPDLEVVGEASDGREALTLTNQLHPDVVVMDIAMPEMEGLELIKHLKRYHPKLPIVAMSGAFEGRFLDAARMLGAKETLQKPFEREALLAALESA
jgi:YesN/AraC family two-component response regulator